MRKILATTFLIVVLVPLLLATYITFLYLQNDYIGVATDFSRSRYAKEVPPSLAAPFTIKIVTFNIQDLWVVGQNRPARMRHIARVLTELDPDVVGFQEAFIAEDRAILMNALEGSRLRYHHYYPSGTGGSGLLISSCWPVHEIYFKRYSQSGPAYRVWEGDFWGGKGAALARIETPVGMIDFYCTHAQAGYGRPNYQSVRISQMAELAAFIRGSKMRNSPAFLVGDMNCRIGNEDYETVIARANLIRLMNLDSRIDHIFGVNDSSYTFETLDTIRIAEKISENGKTFSLSDHPGYMSTIRVTFALPTTEEMLAHSP